MQKSAAAFRTISEVGAVLNVPAHVLRFWESKFTQIKPVKRGGGRRYYRPEDVGLIRGIQHLLYEQGMTIKGAQKVMSERGVKSIIKMGTDLLANGQPVAESRADAAPQQAPARTQNVAQEPTQTISKDELRDIFKQLRIMRRKTRIFLANLN